jgi:hypothetical protein
MMKKLRTLSVGVCLLAAGPVLAARPFEHPAEQLRALSENAKQLWVVSYGGSDTELALADAEASFRNGADAVVFETSNVAAADKTLAAVRAAYPDAVLGVNYLGKSPGAHEGFELARRHRLQIVWTDFSGVDLIKEMPEVSLHSIEKEHPPGVFYVSGIHMKYSTLLDPEKPIEKSALQAMGWVDGVVVTGKGTGQPTDPERARRARSVLGNYPLGAASGVSAENVHTILPYIDFALVHTSIATPDHKIIGSKVAELRAAMDDRRKARK